MAGRKQQRKCSLNWTQTSWLPIGSSKPFAEAKARARAVVTTFHSKQLYWKSSVSPTDLNAFYIATHTRKGCRVRANAVLKQRRSDMQQGWHIVFSQKANKLLWFEFTSPSSISLKTSGNADKWFQHCLARRNVLTRVGSRVFFHWLLTG